LTVTEDHRLHDEGVAITLDGFDTSRRVGYELVTSEAGDRLEVTTEVEIELERRMTAGQLAVFLVDEHDVEDADALAAAAERFLDEAARRGLL
jgi:hypothetical protein